MKQMYVYIGELEGRELLAAYEAVLVENEVKLILPTPNHSGCVSMANSFGFGEKAYFVKGKEVGTDDKGRTILSNFKVVDELYYDTDKQKLLYARPFEEIIDDIQYEEWSFWTKLRFFFFP